jgi:hypothetical protein
MVRICGLPASVHAARERVHRDVLGHDEHVAAAARRARAVARSRTVEHDGAQLGAEGELQLGDECVECHLGHVTSSRLRRRH